MQGLVHIYTGDGKGKTTAAVGLGIRACGRGLRVLMVQFLKGSPTGEVKTIEKLNPGFVIHRGNEIKKFTWEMSMEELEEAKRVQQEIFNYAGSAASSNAWDMIILDEIMAAVAADMVSIADVAGFIKSKPCDLEVVLTGRNAPNELIQLADYVSEIKAVKHPMDKGIPAREGIEL